MSQFCAISLGGAQSSCLCCALRHSAPTAHSLCGRWPPSMAHCTATYAVRAQLLQNLMGYNYDNPSEGYRKYIDVESWVDRLLLFEVGMNSDGLKASMYFHKP